MHEFALVNQILQKVLRTASAHNVDKVSVINLEIGEFAMVIDDLLKRSFEIAAKNSIAENAELILKKTPGVVLCEDCGKKSEIWFNEAVENDDNKHHIEEYQENLTPEKAMGGNHSFGRDMFECKFCHSHRTNLIEGKKILIKNIQI